jgi:hypothetical protein
MDDKIAMGDYYRQPLFVINKEGNNYSNKYITGKVSNDGIFSSDTPLVYNQFIEYIRKAKSNVLNNYMWVTNKEEVLVYCILNNNKIQMIPQMSYTFGNNENGVLVYANKIPVLRRAFAYKYIFVMYEGNTSYKTPQAKFINNSICCYNNEMTVVRSVGNNLLSLTFSEKEAKDRLETKNTVDIEHKFKCSETTNFATTAEYENGVFTVISKTRLQNSENILSGYAVCDKNISIENMWDYFTQNDGTNLIGHEGQNVLEMFKIKDGGQEVLFVNVLKTKIK